MTKHPGEFPSAGTEAEVQAWGKALTAWNDQLRAASPMDEKTGWFKDPHFDAFGEPFDPETATPDEWDAYLARWGSVQRTAALAFAMHKDSNPKRRLRLFLEWGSTIDGPWQWRGWFTSMLQQARAKVDLLPLLEEAEDRAFFEALPQLVPIWRGCEGGRERGMSWTANRSDALKFARGMRVSNKVPTLVSAVIPKQHIFAVFAERGEHEVVVNFRRLRKINVERNLAVELAET